MVMRDDDWCCGWYFLLLLLWMMMMLTMTTVMMKVVVPRWWWWWWWWGWWWWWWWWRRRWWRWCAGDVLWRSCQAQDGEDDDHGDKGYIFYGGTPVTGPWFNTKTVFVGMQIVTIKINNTCTFCGRYSTSRRHWRNNSSIDTNDPYDHWSRC